MHFILTEDDELLEKYGKIWEKFSVFIKSKLDSKPIESEKYLKIKIKWYNDKINIIHHNDKTPKEGSHTTCLSMVLIDSDL